MSNRPIRRRSAVRAIGAALTASAVIMALSTTGPAGAAVVQQGDHGHGGGHGGGNADPDSRKDPVARGGDGAVAWVDPDASEIGTEVLRKGGNATDATDAAVATASALGITEPFSTGIGGGGYFVHFEPPPARPRLSTDARPHSRRCRTTRSSIPRPPNRIRSRPSG